MRRYITAYISNSEQNIKHFQDQGSPYYSVIPIRPLSDIEDLIQAVLSSGAEAMVVDYQLGNKGSFSFNGIDLVEKMCSKREGFPIFILAENMEEAEDGVHDVHIVYDKSSIFSHDRGFFRRVKKQILKYNQQLEEKEDRLIKLMSSKKPLTQQQESEVMALNFTLEKSLDKQHARSMDALTPSNQNKLKDLLDKVGVIIEEINK